MPLEGSREFHRQQAHETAMPMLRKIPDWKPANRYGTRSPSYSLPRAAAAFGAQSRLSHPPQGRLSSSKILPTGRRLLAKCKASAGAPVLSLLCNTEATQPLQDACWQCSCVGPRGMPTGPQAACARLAGLAHHGAQGGLSGGKGGQCVERVCLEHAGQKPCQEARFQVVLSSKSRQRCHLTGFACGMRAWDQHAMCAHTPVPSFAARRWETCSCSDNLIPRAALRRLVNVKGSAVGFCSSCPDSCGSLAAAQRRHGQV